MQGCVIQLACAAKPVFGTARLGRMKQGNKGRKRDEKRRESRLESVYIWKRVWLRWIWITRAWIKQIDCKLDERREGRRKDLLSSVQMSSLRKYLLKLKHLNSELLALLVMVVVVVVLLMLMMQETVVAVAVLVIRHTTAFSARQTNKQTNTSKVYS